MARRLSAVLVAMMVACSADERRDSGEAAAAVDGEPDEDRGAPDEAAPLSPPPSATLGEDPEPPFSTSPGTEGSEPVAGPETFGPPRPPQELAAVDHGYPLVKPVDFGTCPDGTQPSERFACRDAPACHCEYICEPLCNEREVCDVSAAADTSNAHCQCHPALDEVDGECTWTRFVEDGEFTTGTGWNVWTRSTSDAARAEVIDGALELEVTARCSYAWAGTKARIPPANDFPEGAALVFDYTAVGAVGEGSVSFAMNRLEGGEQLLLDGQPHEMRRCALLSEAWQSLLEFAVEVNGLCAEQVDFSLRVDNVRLERDEACL